MKRKNWTVGNYGIRPVGDPDKCFYCGVEKEGVHKKDCVIRSRTIVMKMEIELVMEVPEFWTKKDCEFHKNESSWCANNILPSIEKIVDDHGCICGLTRFKFLRETTPLDEDYYNIHVNDIPS